jgi:hypothetical protein
MKLISVVGMAALMCSTMAVAENPNANQRGSMARAIEVNARNNARNPDNPGLPKARQRLFENAARHASNPHGADAAGAEWEEHVQQVEHVKQAERVERPERPERALSPSVTDRPTAAAFGDRPMPPGLTDRPTPPGLVDRPLPRGFARGR